MFTGIVECTGEIITTRETAGGRRLCIRVPSIAAEARLGDSICVSGVCLTVAAQSRDTLEFDVIRETLARSTLGQKRAGHRVNLESSLRVGDRLDGHFVQGHVDGVADVQRVVASPREHVLWLRPEPHLSPYVIPKGSIAVDGVSLTIAECAGESFSVALIPTTLERTTLSELRPGHRVNLESDILARTIVHRLDGLAAQGGAGAARQSEPRPSGSDVASRLVRGASEPGAQATGGFGASDSLTLESLQKAGLA